jgi:hypothetical protein
MESLVQKRSRVKKYRTAADWAREKPEKLQAELRQINFYRRKTSAIQSACRTLVETFGGQVPDNLDDLVTLPGVGRKTANIVLGNAHLTELKSRGVSHEWTGPHQVIDHDVFGVFHLGCLAAADFWIFAKPGI